MSANQACLPVHTMCRVLDVSASGYYAWQARAPSRHAIEDAVLTERIRLLHAASHGIYGSPTSMPSCATRERAWAGSAWPG